MENYLSFIKLITFGRCNGLVMIKGFCPLCFLGCALRVLKVVVKRKYSHWT